MKRRSLFVLTFAFSLLFTSCLADYLNEKFGYKAPVYIYYHSDHGTTPARKQIESGTALTSEHLPILTPGKDDADYEFAGWYLDKEFINPAAEGYIVNETITLYANWKYESSNNPYTPDLNYVYLVKARLFDPELDVVGFMGTDDYNFITYDYETAITYFIQIPEYEYIPNADNIYLIGDYYINETLFNNVIIIERSYYKTSFPATAFGNAAQFLQGYDDYIFNFFITDYAPDLMVFSYIANAPKVNLHLEGCSGLTEITANAFYQDYWLKEIYLPYSIEKIDNSAFNGCSGLKYIDLPYGLTEIGGQAFFGCNNLESLVIPDSVTKLGQSTFKDCSSLSDITFSMYLTEIPMYCFRGCTNLTIIKFPKNLETIGMESFEDCSLLEEIYLPSTLKTIKDNAFRNCEKLRKVYYQGDSIPSTLRILDTNVDPSNIDWEYPKNY